LLKVRAPFDEATISKRTKTSSEVVSSETTTPLSKRADVGIARTRVLAMLSMPASGVRDAERYDFFEHPLRGDHRGFDDVKIEQARRQLRTLQDVCDAIPRTC